MSSVYFLQVGVLRKDLTDLGIGHDARFLFFLTVSCEIEQQRFLFANEGEFAFAV